MVLIAILKAVDASCPMKLYPGPIPQIFKSVVNFVKTLMISLWIIFFIDVVRMELQ